MAKRFNAEEIFEMAEQIEANGYRFYLTAAQKVKDESLSAMFSRLGQMELDHEETFHEMRTHLEEEGVPRSAFDPDMQAPAYLQALADAQIFNVHRDMSGAIEKVKSPLDLLKMAIRAEKDSVVFYAGIRALVPEDLGRDKIDWLIEQELSHIADLRTQFRTFTK